MDHPHSRETQKQLGKMLSNWKKSSILSAWQSEMIDLLFRRYQKRECGVPYSQLKKWSIDSDVIEGGIASKFHPPERLPRDILAELEPQVKNMVEFLNSMMTDCGLPEATAMFFLRWLKFPPGIMISIQDKHVFLEEIEVPIPVDSDELNALL